MADDPHRAVLAQWRNTHASESDNTTPTTSSQSPLGAHYEPAPPRSHPPSVTRAAGSSLAPPPMALHSHPRQAAQQYTAQYTAQTDTRSTAAEAHARHTGAGVMDGRRHELPPQKGGPTSPLRRRQLPTQPPAAQGTAAREDESDVFHRQREQQRDVQSRLRRKLIAQSGAAASSSSGAAYYELVSPARTMDNGGGYAGNQRDAATGRCHGGTGYVEGATRSSSRRTNPAHALEEIDEELRRSFGEHHFPEVAISRDAAEHSSREADEQEDRVPNGRPTTTGAWSAPPVMEVRMPHPHPRQPFREEISSDLSDYPADAARSPLSSTEPTTHASRPSQEAISEDVGLHLPLTSEFQSIPSISLTPPTSPAHQARHPHQATPNQQARHHEQSAHTNHSNGHVDQAAATAPFPTWGVGFLVGCTVVGLLGIFMDEILQFTGVFSKVTPFMLSRIEQREMNRRLDLLQQELLSFRLAATEIEQQSQRMVQEVRSHLEKMRSERASHQLMISSEMDALRRYVQSVTNELVEDEKKEIRRRLMETIADTIMELPRKEGVEANKTTLVHEQQQHSDPAEPLEVAIAAAEDNVAVLFEDVDEEAVMEQIQHAIARDQVPIHDHVAPQVLPGTTPTIQNEAVADSSTSLFSLEWILLVAAVVVLAGVVGMRVRNAGRRKKKALRGAWRFPARANEKSGPKAASLQEDSEVETVSYFRSDAEESDWDGHYSSTRSDDDGFSTYSEEHKDGEDQSKLESIAASEAGDYEFQPAQSSAELSNDSEIEAIDESPSESRAHGPSTPYPRRTHQQAEALLTDDSPSVRRSPRIQTSSSLSQMR